jgi:hypothetical protein
MYQYYITIKNFISNLQELIDSLELEGNFQHIPDLLLFKNKLENLKADFYNEDISDNILKEKFNQLENSINNYLIENSL